MKNVSVRLKIFHVKLLNNNVCKFYTCEKIQKRVGDSFFGFKIWNMFNIARVKNKFVVLMPVNELLWGSPLVCDNTTLLYIAWNIHHE